MTDKDLLDIRVERNRTGHTPEHHVVERLTGFNWSSYWPQWTASPTNSNARPKISSRSSSRTSRSSLRGGSEDTFLTERRIGFRNPWPSWHKPTRQEVWQALEWGDDTDPCISLAASHLNTDQTNAKQRKVIDYWAQRPKNVRARQAAELLTLVDPDFSFDASKTRAKTTWLGHAGVLIQLPPLTEGGRPIRCLFDPIFSARCSPSQNAGPIRSYPPPCKIESLPPIDVVMISHNHYDHLDYDTIMSLWRLNEEWIRFVVPLGNKDWFVESSVHPDRVEELDWWESAHISQSGSSALKLTCTPSQHNSGRSGMDADLTLWSSWYLEYPSSKPYRIFFAGDSGYQFHSSPGWPPSPPPSIIPQADVAVSQSDPIDSQKYTDDNSPFPACPAFQEIANRLDSPHLLLLPIAVGATFSFLRSYVPLPDSISPFPRHTSGLTAANHMPPWDAVKVMQLMTKRDKSEDNNDASDGEDESPVAIAMHWGTFVTDPSEVLKTLGQLEWACIAHNVKFARELEENRSTDEVDKQAYFLAVNHGESVVT